MFTRLLVRPKAVDKLNQSQIQVVRLHGENICETLLFVKCIIPLQMASFGRNGGVYPLLP
jgi:hypothetical protein